MLNVFTEGDDNLSFQVHQAGLCHPHKQSKERVR